jgi:prepilin-type N-terminal cleavage/methylation domain-containing protein
MRAHRGFTLIEIVIVLLVASVLATAGMVGYRASQRNAKLSGAANQLAVRMAGLKYEAISAGTDHLLVFADAPGGDSSDCGVTNSSACARYFVLERPAAGWTLAAFDASAPATGAELVLEELLPRGAHLDVGGAAPPMAPPFGAVAVHDADLTATCAGDRKCFAVRYTARGDVRAEPPAGGLAPGEAGYAFVISGDASVQGANEKRGLMVTFPAGILRTFAFQEQP